MKFVLGLGVLSLMVAVLSGCSTSRQMLIGEWEDDYGIQYRISETLWDQNPGGQYLISKWDAEQGFLIAQNDSTNSEDAGLWTRIDWVPLEGMAPYEWAFCLSAYRENSAESAEVIRIADRSNPRVGCNGFPFSRMKRASVSPALDGSYEESE